MHKKLQRMGAERTRGEEIPNILRLELGTQQARMIEQSCHPRAHKQPVKTSRMTGMEHFRGNKKKEEMTGQPCDFHMSLI